MTINHEELRKLAEAATPGPWEWEGDLEEGEAGLGQPDVNGYVLSAYGLHTEGFVDVDRADAEFIAAANPSVVLALLDENERLRNFIDTPSPCEMTHTPPFDFAQCETHDTTFPLGGACKWHGKESIAGVLQDEIDEQRGLKVRAELTIERAQGVVYRAQTYGADEFGAYKREIAAALGLTAGQEREKG